MVNFVNCVANSMISAASQMKLAGVAIGVFESAKARGDTALMDRAASYAAPCLSDAMKHSSDISDELKKAQEDARKEARREMEEARKEQTQKASEEKEVTNEANTNNDSIEPDSAAVSDIAADVYVTSDNAVVSVSDSTPISVSVSGTNIDVQA